MSFNRQKPRPPAFTPAHTDRSHAHQPSHQHTLTVHSWDRKARQTTRHVDTDTENIVWLWHCDCVRNYQWVDGRTTQGHMDTHSRPSTLAIHTRSRPSTLAINTHILSWQLPGRAANPWDHSDPVYPRIFLFASVPWRIKFTLPGHWLVGGFCLPNRWCHSRENSCQTGCQQTISTCSSTCQELLITFQLAAQHVNNCWSQPVGHLHSNTDHVLLCSCNQHSTVLLIISQWCHLWMRLTNWHKLVNNNLDVCTATSVNVLALHY